MGQDQPIMVRLSKAYALGTTAVAALMALFFAGMTIYVATKLPGAWAIATIVFCLVFFTGFAAIAWWGWRWISGGRVMALITDSGIIAAPKSRAPVSLKWEEVQDVLLLRENALLKRPRMLMALPANPTAFLDRLTTSQRLRMRLAWFLHRVKWGIAFGDWLEIPLEELGTHLASALGRPLQQK